MKYEQQEGGALALFDRPVMFHRIFVGWTGSVKAALMLSYLIFWQRTRPGGWVYKTWRDWEQDLGFSRKESIGARKALKDRGYIEEKIRGVPPRTHYRIRESLVRKFVNFQLLQKGTNGIVTKGNNQLLPKGTNNSENTTYSGRSRCDAADAGLVAPEDSKIRFSKAVSVYAKWAVSRGYHLRSRVPLLYARGAAQGGWSRPTLIKWQKAYSALCAQLGQEKVDKLIQFYLKHHDDEFAPEARTLMAFAQRWEKIDKFMRRRLRERNGHSHHHDEESPQKTADKLDRRVHLSKKEKERLWKQARGY